MTTKEHKATIPGEVQQHLIHNVKSQILKLSREK